MEKGVTKGIRNCLLASIIIGGIYLISCLLIVMNGEQIVGLFNPSLGVNRIVLPISVMINMLLIGMSILFCMVLLLKGRKKRIHINTLTIGISVITGLTIIARLLAPFISIYETKFIGINEGAEGVALVGIIISTTQYVSVFAYVSMILFYLGTGLWIGRHTTQETAKVNK